MTASVPKTAAGFLTTSWTLIASARDNPADFERLLRLYWNPIYGYIRRRGFSRSDAEDLTQQFIVSVVIQRDLVGRADSARGRFRSFVLACLKRFLVDETRRPRMSAMDGDAMDALGVECAAGNGQGDSPDDVFNREWATAVLEIAMERLEETCRREGMQRQWRVFESRTMQPAIHNSEPAAIETLMSELSVRDRQTIYSMHQTMQRKAERMITEVIAETVQDDRELESEMEWMRSLFAS